MTTPQSSSYRPLSSITAANPIAYKFLGTSDLKISTLGVGTMMMGWRMDQTQSRELLASALAHGINFLDSSVSYARGLCHEILGQALKDLGTRNQFVIATKVGGIAKDDDPPHLRGYTRTNILHQCDLSLKQLQIDCIDLLQLHYPNAQTPIEESLLALDELVKLGKIRYYGLCNHSNTQWLAAQKATQTLGISPLTSHQISHNLINAHENLEILTAARQSHAGILAWGPLSSGLLTDWYTQNPRTLKPSSRIASGREHDAKLTLLNSESVQNILQRLANASTETHLSAQQLAIAWVMKQPHISSVLLGPSSVTQFEQLVQARAENIPSDF